MSLTEPEKRDRTRREEGEVNNLGMRSPIDFLVILLSIFIQNAIRVAPI